MKLVTCLISTPSEILDILTSDKLRTLWERNIKLIQKIGKD